MADEVICDSYSSRLTRCDSQRSIPMCSDCTIEQTTIVWRLQVIINNKRWITITELNKNTIYLHDLHKFNAHRYWHAVAALLPRIPSFRFQSKGRFSARRLTNRIPVTTYIRWSNVPPQNTAPIAETTYSYLIASIETNVTMSTRTTQRSSAREREFSRAGYYIPASWRPHAI
mgnify:CR=1 FL=1